MKGGVTRRVEDAIKALDQGQVKKALFLTENPKTERHHQIVSLAAKQCLSNQDQCPDFLKSAAKELKETITAPLDDTSLEGIEGMLESETKIETKTDEELYEDCEECHIANAVVKAVEICEQYPQDVCSIITQKVGNEDIQPMEWLKTLKQATDQAEGPAKGELAVIVGEVSDYLEKRNSPFLEALKEEENG